MKEKLGQMENVENKENKKPKFSLGGLREKVVNKKLLKGVAVSLGLFLGGKELGAKNIEINIKENTETSFGKDSQQNKNKSEIGFVEFDDFSEPLDSIKNPNEKYGYKLLGQRKMVGEMRNYYGVDKNIKADEPFNIQKTREELNKIGTKKLGDLYNMGSGKMLFYNFSLDGKAHIVELDGEVEVFLEKNQIYAVVCGNLLKPVLGIDYDEVAQKTTKSDTKIITKQDLEKANLVGVGDAKKENKEQMVLIVLKQAKYKWDNFTNRLLPANGGRIETVLDSEGKPITKKIPVSEVGNYVGGEFFLDGYTGKDYTVKPPRNVVDRSRSLADQALEHSDAHGYVNIYSYEPLNTSR